MANLTITINEINALDPRVLAKDERVRDRFIYIYETIWGPGTGEAAYERESFHFNSKIMDDPKLQACTRFSVFSSFIDLAILGLSIEPGSRAQAYIQPRNTCIGQTPDGKKAYEQRMVVTVSGYGELLMRQRAGQIRHADNPVLVYAEDTFSFGENNGQKIVNYMCNLPHQSGHVVAAYMKITRADGSIDYSVMLEDDWKRLQGYSGKANRFYDRNTNSYVERPNELYTANDGSIDTGFLCAKLIKHAFRTYPKVRVGKYTEFESQQEDPKLQDLDDIYGVSQPAPDYAQPADLSSGVIINPATAASTTTAASPATVPADSSAADDAF